MLRFSFENKLQPLGQATRWQVNMTAEGRIHAAATFAVLINPVWVHTLTTLGLLRVSLVMPRNNSSHFS